MTYNRIMMRQLIWRTKEQTAGTPDWYVYRERKGEWYANGRLRRAVGRPRSGEPIATSAVRNGPFRTRQLAQAYAETASLSMAMRRKALAEAGV